MIDMFKIDFLTKLKNLDRSKKSCISLYFRTFVDEINTITIFKIQKSELLNDNPSTKMINRND